MEKKNVEGEGVGLYWRRFLPIGKNVGGRGLLETNVRRVSATEAAA